MDVNTSIVAVPDVAVNPTIGDANGRRYRQLRRALLRSAGPMPRKPTTREAAALDRAAALTLRAEQALHDGTSANDLVRLDRLAAAARRACADLLRSASLPSMGDLLRRQARG